MATADKAPSQDGKQQRAAADVDEGVPPQNRSSTSVLSSSSEGGAASEFDCSSSSDESHEGQEFDSANLEAMAVAIQARCAHAQEVGAAPARVPAFVCVCRLGRDRR